MSIPDSGVWALIIVGVLVFFALLVDSTVLWVCVGVVIWTMVGFVAWLLFRQPWRQRR